MNAVDHNNEKFNAEFRISVVLNLEFVGIQYGLTEETVGLTSLDRSQRLCQIALKAIQLCAVHRVIVPDWAARAFSERYEKIETLEYRSWDDAFGKPFKSGNKTKYEFDKHKRLEYCAFIEAQWQQLGKRKRTDSFVKTVCAHFKEKDGAAVGEKVIWTLIGEILDHYKLFGAPVLPEVDQAAQKQARDTRRAIRGVSKR